MYFNGLWCTWIWSSGCKRLLLPCCRFSEFPREAYWILLLLPLIGCEWLASTRSQPVNPTDVFRQALASPLSLEFIIGCSFLLGKKDSKFSWKQEIKHQGAPWLLKALALHHIIRYRRMVYWRYNLNHLHTRLDAGFLAIQFSISQVT